MFRASWVAGHRQRTGVTTGWVLPLLPQMLGIQTVALMFLTTGPIPHERTWRLWLEGAAGWLPYQGLPVAKQAACSGGEQQWQRVAHGCDPSQQHLYRLYVHALPNFTGKPAGGGTRSRTAAGAGVAGAAGLGGGSRPALLPWRVLAGLHTLRCWTLPCVPTALPAPPRPPLPASPPGYDPSSIFHDRLVPYRVVTEWGGMSLVVAERLLLQAALQEPTNSRFLLVSDSGIPLYDPLTFYQQLMHEERSRVKACRVGYLSDYRWHPVMAVRHRGVECACVICVGGFRGGRDGGWHWVGRGCVRVERSRRRHRREAVQLATHAPLLRPGRGCCWRVARVWPDRPSPT
jgi:hypothetical protein